MVLAQGAAIAPNENLVTEGIPSIPATLAETVDRYTQFRSASLSSWHPTKREMLISTRFADTPQVHLVKFPLGSRQQMTFFPERVSGATYQPTQGDYFVLSKDIGGNEFSQNYRHNFETGDVTLLTDGKSKNSRGIWSNRGDRMIYTSTRRTGQDTDFYSIDPANSQSDRLLSTVEGGGWGGLSWSPDDRQLLIQEYVSVNESYLWLVDTRSGEKTLITPKNGKEKISYQGGVFSKDGKGLYVVSDRDSEFSRLAYVDLATSQPTYLTSQIPWDVEDFDLSKDGKHLAFVTNEDGASVLHILDTATRKEISLPKLPVGLVYGITWHRNNQDLGFTLISARSTADVYSLNLVTNKVDRWTESETGGLNTSKFSEPELVRWKSFDDKSISGFLYRPPAKFAGKRPVIIDIHGGPEGQFRPVFLGRANYYLNELGVAMIFPNVRGSTGYGKTFLKLDDGFLREDSVKDIGALLDWIATQPDLDKDRILVTGGSYGGYMSLAVATHYSDRIRASIDIVGISNFVTFLEKTEGYRRDLRRVEYGDERDPKMREFLLKISPVNNADRIQKPLFVIHGKNDPRVPLNEAEQIVATVRKNQVPIWYLMAKDEGHGFSKKKNVDFQFYATVTYVKETLLK
ncbi:S9 family peptidase [Phormidesmis priestleyi ULC007]|uniref:S9 family peptidase n=1 Tax=Phormidesmis priestleyi ULC007 TaxID=1920490 RepID=A0A2T1DBA7_9CYAN|nr:S9 family peptidase [Phormidesmis priestleyi]PSB17737.1 S9 family peptidase [Phormidesmis priestleyi ULC007]PZO48678.1 MAG: S9 family peptidase [Phormidesmis priestleyi]